MVRSVRIAAVVALAWGAAAEAQESPAVEPAEPAAEVAPAVESGTPPAADTTAAPAPTSDAPVAEATSPSTPATPAKRTKLSSPAGTDDPRGGLTIALVAAGGFDLRTRQPWAGLDLGFHPDVFRGFSFIGRVRGGWGFIDGRPLGHIEAGFVGVVPAQDVTARVGLVAQTLVYAAPYDLPAQIGGSPEPGSWGNVGFLPGGAAVLELGWRRAGERGPAAWSLGVRAGAGLAITGVACPSPNEDDVCVGSASTFVGGVTGRMQLHEGLFVEALLGPTLSAGIGYAF
jgi:hypothetical protein